MAEVLQALDYEVQSACNGAEALAKIRSAPPDLMLVDLRMPVMNGRQLLAACRADRVCAAIPVIVLSAASSEACALAREYRAPLVTKPFDIAPLLATVQELEDSERRPALQS